MGKKFLANLRVIVEAEDWSEAFDYLDELLKADNHPILSSMDVTVKSSSIDHLDSTRRTFVPKAPYARLTRKRVS